MGAENDSVANPVVASCDVVSRSAMIDAMRLVEAVFSGLSALVIEDVTDGGDMIRVRARTRAGAITCPGCGTETGRVHGYHERTVGDVPADGRRVVVTVRARRMHCLVLGCRRQTFREQVPGVMERYQRRTPRLAGQVAAVSRELAGRATARVLAWLGMSVGTPVIAHATGNLPGLIGPDAGILVPLDAGPRPLDRRSNRYRIGLAAAVGCAA